MLNDAAKQLGVDATKLSAALKQALANRVDAAVKAGQLTEAQGKELKARIQAESFPILGLRGGAPRPPRTGLPPPRGGRDLPRHHRGRSPHEPRERQDARTGREGQGQVGRRPDRRARRRQDEGARRRGGGRTPDEGAAGRRLAANLKERVTAHRERRAARRWAAPLPPQRASAARHFGSAGASREPAPQTA